MAWSKKFEARFNQAIAAQPIAAKVEAFLQLNR